MRRIINSQPIHFIITKLILLCTYISFCGACESCDKGSKNNELAQASITNEMINVAKNYSEHGRTPFLEELLQKLKNNEQVDINTKDPYGVGTNPPSGETALHRAIEVNHVGIVEALLARKADVNQVDNLGNTPLHQAAVKGNISIFGLLLAQPHVDVNKQGDYKQTPLHLAAEWGNLEVVKLLLNCPGIQVELEDGGNHTPLQLVCGMGNRQENKTKINNLLKAKGATK